MAAMNMLNRERVTVVFFGLLGLFFAFRPELISAFHWMQADPGDTRLNEYMLEHGFRWLTGDPLHASFWDAPFFFPAKNVFAYSDVLLGTAPIYWIFRLLRLSADTSFQLWLVTISLLNYWIAYLFLRKQLRYRALASALGAFLFAFASPRICQLGHEQMIAQFWSVLALWAILRAVGPGQKKAFGYIFWGAVCFVLQLYSGFYLGWFLVYAGFLCLVYCLARPSLRGLTMTFLAENAGAIAICGVLAGIALLPMGWHYWLAVKALGTRDFSEVQYYSPRVQSWFYLGEWSWLYRWQEHVSFLTQLYARTEQRLSLGWFTSGLVAWVLFKKRREGFFGSLFFVTAAILLLSTRIFHDDRLSLWYPGAYFWFPGARGIRSLSRIVLVLLIPAMVAVAEFFNERKLWKPAVGAILCLIVLEQGQSLQYFVKAENQGVIRAISERIPRQCPAFVLLTDGWKLSREYDWDRDAQYHLDAMWASIAAGIPTLNGYSGNLPPGWDLHTVDPPQEMEKRLQAWVSKNGMNRHDFCDILFTPPRVESHILL